MSSSALARRVVLVLVLGVVGAACGAADKDKSTGGEPAATQGDLRDEQPPLNDEPPQNPGASGQVACETLDRAECLSALHCTMHWVKDGQYECLTSRGACEVDLIQLDRTTCESREGCTWNPGSCYCPFPGYGQTQVKDKDQNTGGACACGGGPPSRCEPAARP